MPCDLTFSLARRALYKERTAVREVVVVACTASVFGLINMADVTTIAGFSLVNRWLLYTSILLTPAQFISGLGSHCPSNIGFLAFNWYSQIHWYQAVKAKQLHALSMVLPHFTIVYFLSYLGGISSGNYPMGAILGLGTAGVMVLNTVSLWTSWATNMADGYGVYQFFFYGWRTLTPDWHKFFLAWSLFDTMGAASNIVVVCIASIVIPHDTDHKPRWWYTYTAIPLGAIVALFFIFPLILWTELIIARNHIESATDWVSVWLFVAQVVTMLVPACGFFGMEDEEDNGAKSSWRSRLSTWFHRE